VKHNGLLWACQGCARSMSACSLQNLLRPSIVWLLPTGVGVGDLPAIQGSEGYQPRAQYRECHVLFACSITHR
jgi:hypothetical protein